MNISRLELYARNLPAQEADYAKVLGLPVMSSPGRLTITAGATTLIFQQAAPDFDGAYHFAFNIPSNQFQASKAWISRRVSMLTNAEGRDEFFSEDWNSESLYFKDPAGNVLEFIARHGLGNAVDDVFDSHHILNISEIGLPAEDVIRWANELCVQLGISVFKQEPEATFMPVGDDLGLLILPVVNRVWFPNSGVPAKLLPVYVQVDVNGRGYEIRGMPYVIQPLT